MLPPPPRSTLFPTRRSSDLFQTGERAARPCSLRDPDGIFERRPDDASKIGTRKREGYMRSEEHTSELQHSQISYAVFCLKKKKKKKKKHKAKTQTNQNKKQN